MIGLTLSFFFVLLSSTGGILLTYLFDETSPFWVRAAFGVSLGLVGSSLVNFAVASFFGLSALSIGLSVVGWFLCTFFIARRHHRRLIKDTGRAGDAMRTSFTKRRKESLLIAVYAVVMFLFLVRIFHRGFFEENGGIHTGMIDNFADLTLHLGIVNSFVLGDNFPPEHPAMAGARLSYPFLADFMAAIFVKLGAGYSQAFLFQNIVIALASVCLLVRFAGLVTGDRAAGLLAPVLLFFNGGMGWTLLIKESRANESGLLALLKHLPHDYTSFEETFRWNNSLLYWFIPMRSMLLAVPLLCSVWILWWQAIERWRNRPKSNQRQLMLASGIIAGFMPLVHAHSFAALMGTAVVLTIIYRRWREWFLFAGTAMVIAVPQIVLIASGSGMHANNFFAWAWGWTKGDHGFFWYWFLNTGLFIPALVFSLVWLYRCGKISKDSILFFAPFTLWFIIPNIVRLAPWIWDNIKILYIWFLGSIPFVAALLTYLWRKGAWFRAAAVVLFITLTLSSGLDVYRQIATPPSLEVYSVEERRFADLLCERTSPKSLIMSAPVHNTPVLLTGRRLVMAYAGTIWTQGMFYEDTEKDIKTIFEGKPEAMAILERRHIDYILVTPKEEYWTKSVNTTINTEFLSRFPQIQFPTDNPDRKYTIYEIKPPNS